MCVALSPQSQHSEGKYMVVNIHDGGKVSPALTGCATERKKRVLMIVLSQLKQNLR